MKTIGVIGGMSWHSTATCYRLLNEETHRRLGGHHSARIALHSVEFSEIEAWQRNDCWEPIGRTLSKAAQSLELGGADFIMIACNTVHHVFDEVESNVAIPLLHIGDAMGAHLKSHGVRRAGLLGTRFTLESGFLRDRLQYRHQIETHIPSESDRIEISRIVYEELTFGNVRDDSRKTFTEVASRFADAGIDDVILACTELSMLTATPLQQPRIHDTLEIHAKAAVDLALK